MPLSDDILAALRSGNVGSILINPSDREAIFSDIPGNPSVSYLGRVADIPIHMSDDVPPGSIQLLSRRPSDYTQLSLIERSSLGPDSSNLDRFNERMAQTMSIPPEMLVPDLLHHDKEPSEPKQYTLWDHLVEED